MDDNLFIPVQQLNTLRRTALEKLKEKIEGQYIRNPGVTPEFMTPAISKTEQVSGKNCHTAVNQRFTVSVETEEQLKATAHLIENGIPVSRIYLDGSILETAMAEAGQHSFPGLVKRLRESRVEIFTALPHIFRSTEIFLLEQLLDISDGLSLDGALIRNCGEFQFLKERGFDKTVILDHNLYVFNKYAKKFWNRLGITEYSAPLELTGEELEQLGINDCELEIYGAAPVMVSAQCLFKTSGRCRKDYGFSLLTDRYGNRFPVKAFCGSCYNVIYNDRPLCLAKYRKDILRLNPGHLRIRFTTESEEEVTEILKNMTEVFGNFVSGHPEESSVAGKMPCRYTEGHFKKRIL